MHKNPVLHASLFEKHSYHFFNFEIKKSLKPTATGETFITEAKLTFQKSITSDIVWFSENISSASEYFLSTFSVK